MVSYSRAEGISGVISSENDDADAIISVKEIIGRDQVMHDWKRDRVAPGYREFKACKYCRGRMWSVLFRSVEFDDGDRSVQ
jgi:hypothetical protein